MTLSSLFEKGANEDLFTDFDVCIKGAYQESFSGGTHISSGARLFDVASLTKACTHLLFLRLFQERILKPNEPFTKYVSVPESEGAKRELWHFLCYLVQSYAFDYETVRKGHKCLREELLTKGFGGWGQRFKYDNISSAYLGILLEEKFGRGLEDVFKDWFEIGEEPFFFHPAVTGRMDPDFIIPTRKDNSERGRVHDTLSRNHERYNLSVAGIFSTAEVMARIFHDGIDHLIRFGTYGEVAKNQLTKIGVTEHSYGLGFDIPFPSSLQGLNVEDPLIFAGFTGCRLFFTRRPRITVCFLTNRVYSNDTEWSRKRFTEFSWEVIRTAIKHAV